MPERTIPTVSLVSRHEGAGGKAVILAAVAGGVYGRVAFDVCGSGFRVEQGLTRADAEALALRWTGGAA